MKIITKDMSIEDALRGHPALTKIFIDFGIPCLVCGEPYWGTIEELAKEHNVDIEELINKLNDKMREIDEKI